MMHSAFQKMISVVIISFLLFGISIDIPFSGMWNTTDAGTTREYSLVSILVDESIYPDIEVNVNRYAQDIQSQLENTRVVILPTPATASVFDIASLNESLFYTGYEIINKNAGFKSKLVGTVLVGDVPLPVAYNGTTSGKTLAPYVDFDDKSYIFSHDDNKYIENENNLSSFSPEIWHGVISPNTGSIEGNIDSINDYFDKNHDYYLGIGKFEAENGIHNGNKSEDLLEGYEPYVFYYDQFREGAALSFEKYQGYEAYLENKEDLVYNRYSKELSEKIKTKVLGNEQEQIKDLVDGLGLDFDEGLYGTGPDVSGTSDISTRYITDNVVKKFLEVINTSKIGEFRKDVHNAGRYNGEGTSVNSDMIPYLVSVLDVVGDEVIKGVNNDLELEIDTLVEEKLSRDIAVAQNYVTSVGSCSYDTYTNFLYGLPTSDVTTAYDCTIYRGSTENGGTLVEANRGLNINNIGKEVKIGNDIKYTGGDLEMCTNGQTLGFWGGNSPVNLNKEMLGNGVLQLNTERVASDTSPSVGAQKDLAIRPLFDMKGAVRVTDSNLIPSPLNCLESNYILTKGYDWVTGYGSDPVPVCELVYSVPYISGVERQGINWECSSANVKRAVGTSFESRYKNLSANGCDRVSVQLSGTTVKSVRGSTPLSSGSGENERTCSPDIIRYPYKKIPSIMKHVAPTAFDVSEQVNAMIVASLPIDKNRYVDFISPIGNHVKIEYPYLFRLKKDLSIYDTLDEKLSAIEGYVDTFLDEKSSEINTLITNNKATGLSGEDKEIFELLYDKEYPQANFDLKAILKSKSSKGFEIVGDSKDISYYETLVFAVFWNNLDSVSQKYQFVFQNYLSDQFGDNSGYSLAKNKKQYEIAYLGAPGDAQNMYIKIDPSDKEGHPYAETLSDNSVLDSYLFSSQVTAATPGESEGVFACSPPEGVPLWEWIPAITCRLQDLLPPKISFSGSSCGVENLLEGSNVSVYDYGQTTEICELDENKNSISDCLEGEIASGVAKLSGDLKRVYYNKNITLETQLQNGSGALMNSVSYLSTVYELIKVEAPKNIDIDFTEANSKIIFDRESLNESSYADASKYISFTQAAIPLTFGKSNYIFSSKGLDANVYFRSRVLLYDDNNEIIQEKQSNEFKVEIRGNSLFASLDTIDITGEVNTYDIFEASNATNIYIIDGGKSSLLENKTSITNSSLAPLKNVLTLNNYSINGSDTPINYPITVSLYHESEQLFENISYEEDDLENFVAFASLSKSGRYTIQVVDVYGTTLSRTFNVAPGIVTNTDIELGSSILEKDGTITSNVIVLKDEYGNIGVGEPYQVSVTVIGDGLVLVGDNSEKVSQRVSSTFDGFTAFRLAPTGVASENTVNVEVKYEGEIVSSKNIVVQTIDKINIDIKQSDTDIIVGGKNYELLLEYSDNEGNILTNFDSSVYISLNGLYADFEKEMFQVKNGVATLPFSTNTLAGKDVSFLLNTQGLSFSSTKTLDFLPEAPLKIDAVLSQNNIQAKTGVNTNLSIELKDRYNNIVFTDSSTKVSIGTNDDSKKIITTATSQKTLSQGIASFTLDATGTPGKAYVTIESDTDLSSNFFMVGEGENAIKVEGVGKNVVMLETYYFWNKDSIIGNNYNALYSVLLGSEYGDYSQENYLAGDIIFDRDNRSLAVTSLLNNPYDFDDIIKIGSHGSITDTTSGEIDQDISLDVAFDSEDRMYIDIFNNSLNTYIGKTYYSFPDNTDLKTCAGTTGSISECGVMNEKSSITLKSYSQKYSVSGIDNQLELTNTDGEKLLIISADGKIIRNSLLQTRIGSGVREEGLVLEFVSGTEVIAQALVYISDPQVLVSRNTQNTDLKLENTSNSIIIELSSYLYGMRDKHSENGLGYALYYKDPFGDAKELSDVSTTTLFSVENFYEQEAIGWEQGNKFILNFSAGVILGESVNSGMSFGTVTHGDPVISLKKIQQKFSDKLTVKSFDATIGELLSDDEDLENYKIFDYDNDKKDDILLIKENGYLSLLENKNNAKPFANKGNLAYIADMGSSDYVEVGDFTGDGFDDIFFMNDKGFPYLLNNKTKDFVRVELQEQFNLDGKITQVSTFDMDNDTISDLITLDDSGKIYIFYGGGTSANPEFTKKLVGDGYGLKLKSGTQDSGAFLSFDGIVDLGEQDLYDSYIAEAEAFSDVDDNSNGSINQNLLDKIIFEKILYREPTISATKATPEEFLVDFQLSDNEDYIEESSAAKKTVEEFFANNGEDVTITGLNATQKTVFIKSEYSGSLGLEIEKKYTDINNENVQTGDRIQVNVKIKNSTSSTLENLVYIDSLPEYFTLSGEALDLPEIYGGKQRIAPGGYDLLVDGINLPAGEEYSFDYYMIVSPIKFGFLQVGLYEQGEVGDDNFGDIIVKPNSLNCAETVDMYRSIAARSYSKEESAPVCDDSKTMLPEVLERNKTDLDKNGIPDYIDEINSGTGAQQEYAKNQLANILVDSDGDGRPDSEDHSPHFNNESSDGNFLSVLDDINESIDDISEGIDVMLDGFGCGFGGGSCYSSPLNYSPLVAGTDPTFMGTPIGDGLRVDEGIPIFSAFTGMNIFTSFGCFQVPIFWPATSNRFGGGCNFNSQAGGNLGVTSPTNFMRLYATVTLTGGAGIAACFGGNASIAGNSNPKGVSPVIPGGNCVVVAKPLTSCSNDGSEGDPGSLGQVDYFGNFGIINANCGSEDKKTAIPEINSEFIQDYYDFKNTGVQKPTLYTKYISLIKEIESKESTASLSIFDGGASGLSSDADFSVELDFSSENNGNFEDVVQVSNERVAAFPGFLMEWITRQGEEFITKLTDLPTLFIILPDFSPLFDTDWSESMQNDKKELQDEKKAEDSDFNANINSQISSINLQKTNLDCFEGGKGSRECLALDIKEGQLQNSQRDYAHTQSLESNSGIRAVYEFLGSIPLIDVVPEKVSITYPVLDDVSTNKWLLEAGSVVEQWENELQRFTNQLPGGQDCSTLVGPDATACLQVNAQLSVQQSGALKLLSTFQANIQTVKEYKQTPEKISALLNQKEEWAEQLLCSVDGLAEFTNGWISENGKRFKAWVEVYVLIKAILKSWQLLFDVFQGYEEECHECKNERDDLLQSQFKLVSMVLPKMPVVTFPKWPDVIFDIHNIRLGITIKIPDFTIEQRPIVLPQIPELVLPSFSANVDLSTSLDFEIPDMPLLPSIDIPELGGFELPSLPSIELPNLPPPPTLPKIFSGFKSMVNIAKLVTKAMCIMKSSPFVPEWRAGDQIAFLTERNGFLPTDFLDKTIPSISFPMIDAIKVTAKVNLEQDTDFLVQMAKQMVEPVNSIGNNISNSFSTAGIDTLDFSSASQDIDVSGSVGATISDSGVDIDASSWTDLFIKGSVKMLGYLEENKDERLQSREFIALVNTELASLDITSRPETAELQTLWKNVSKYSYSAEDKTINDLRESSLQKFDVLREILEKEKEKTKLLRESFKEVKVDTLFTNVSQTSVAHNDFVEYKKSLDVSNRDFMQKAKTLVLGGGDIEQKQIQESGAKVLTNLQAYSLGTLAAVGNGKISPINTCEQSDDSDYGYDYEGMYIIEGDKSYRLFAYLDELEGDEQYSVSDYDGDSDKDLIYFVNGELYLKKNLDIAEFTTPISLPILDVDSSENPYFNGNNFLEAINGLREINTDSRVLNLSFNAPNDSSVHNFRLETYTIIDKFLNEDSSSYIPEGVLKKQTDAFDSIETITIVGDNEVFTQRKHLVTMDYIGTTPGVTLQTQAFKNIKEDIQENNRVVLSPETQLYTNYDSAKINYYYTQSPDEELSLTLEAHSSYEWDEGITLIGITGDAYVMLDETVTLTGRNELLSYQGLPLFADSKIDIIGDFRTSFNEASTIELLYYDGGEYTLDLADLEEYMVYDLGHNSSDYLLRYSIENDYLYSKIAAFKNNHITTVSSQVLSSPQREADGFAPELEFTSDILVPVYQKKLVDLSNSIYDNVGLSSIKKIYVDLDLETDSDGDGNPINDSDNDKLIIEQTPSRITLEFGPYEELLTKKIMVWLEDENKNVSSKELTLEVYAPTPYIRQAADNRVQGILSEKLVGEPINLYRMRGGVLKRLEDESGEIKVFTVDDGVYNFDSSSNASGLELKYNGVEIGSINEFSGKITLKDVLSRIDISSGTGGYPTMKVYNGSGIEIYSQQIKVSTDLPVELVDDFETIEKEGIYVDLISKDLYNYYSIPTGSQYNPGTLVIYRQSDKSKTPLFTIYPDGRLSTSSELYILEYLENDNYVGYRLVSRTGNVQIAEVLYKLQGSYLMK